MPAITCNFYQVLEVDPWATQEAIEYAYRRLALLYHPDLNKLQDANHKMQLVNEAYTTLRIPARREKYDRERGVSHPARHKPDPWESPSKKAHPPHPPVHEQPSVQTDSPTHEQVLVFYLDHSSFGLNLRDVEGVLMMQPICPDSKLPAFIEGVISARGAKVPIVDLRRLLGLPTIPVTKTSRIVLSSFQNLQVGLVVDMVENYVNIPADAIEIPPSIAVEGDASFIRGIAKMGFQLIILLELQELFTTEEKNSLSFYN